MKFPLRKSVKIRPTHPRK